MPKTLRAGLFRIGLLESTGVLAGKTLADHLADFEAAPPAKGGVEPHARAVANHARRIIEDCGFGF